MRNLLLRKWERVRGEHPSAPEATGVLDIGTADIEGQVLRYGRRIGKRGTPPLLLFNGIGANLELMGPFVAALDKSIGAVVFDVPGVGGSPRPRAPYRFSRIAHLGERLMHKLGYDEAFDVLGISWGGAVAQQFAADYPRRCRRLVLVATSPGALMVPGKIGVIAKLASPRRYTDPEFVRKVGGDLYGGIYRKNPELLHHHAQHMKPPAGRGYLYQLLAGTGWSSLPWLRNLHQPTLVFHGTDDPIVPLTNAKILAYLIPNSTLRVIDCGHLFLVSRANDVAPVISKFLLEDRV